MRYVNSRTIDSDGVNQVQSYFYEIKFGDEFTEPQRWDFTDELLKSLESTGLVAGGVQNPRVLELAVDNLADTELSATIEDYIRSQCAKHPCVVSWRRRDETEIV